MTGPDVYGPAEARKVLGVGQARLYKLSHRGDFPACTELEIGRVWDGAEIRAYALGRRGGRFEGRPVLRALYAQRRGESYGEMGRTFDVAPTTVAAWLRAIRA